MAGVTADPAALGPPDRNQRIKDARGEATKEIEELKAKKDAEFKQFESHVRPFSRSPGRPCADARPHPVPDRHQHSGDSSTSQGELDKTTTDALAKIKSSFEQNKGSVVDELLSRVVEVKAAPHRNYTPPAKA